MKKVFFLSALLCASLMTFAIDWSAIDYLGDGAGGGIYSNKYKIACDAGQSYVNIQQPGFAAEAGIYTTVGEGISSCSLGDKCAIQGAGVVLYLSAFTAKETEVTITTGVKDYVCTVYYEDGTDASAIQNIEATAKTVKVIENGQLLIIKDGVRYNAAGVQVK